MGNKSRKETTNGMVPLFSFRSMLSIFLGLIIGAVVGFGYSSVSDSNAEIGGSWPPLQIVSGSDITTYATSVQGRMLAVSPTESDLRNMDLNEQYYAAKIASYPFMKYLSEKLAKNYSQYSRTADELSKMIKVRYLILADNPSIIEITTSGPSQQEALFLAQKLPEIFQEFLITESINQKAETYELILKQIDITKQALYQAGEDLIDSKTVEDLSPTEMTPEYISLSARIQSLENELIAQADQAARYLAMSTGSSTTTQTTISPVSTTTPSTRITTSSDTSTGVTSGNLGPGAIDAKIKGLEEMIVLKATLNAGLNKGPGSTTVGSTETTLANAYREASQQGYITSLNALVSTSSELAKAKANMMVLQARVITEREPIDNETLTKRMDFQYASTRIDSLTTKLDELNEQLVMTNPSGPPSQLPEFYATGEIQDPEYVNSTRNAPILGAVIGMFCGWMVINRRWLFQSNQSIHNDESGKEIEEK